MRPFRPSERPGVLYVILVIIAVILVFALLRVRRSRS
jgi:hypothetical protein